MMTTEDVMTRTRVRRMHTLSDVDLDRLARISAIRTAGNASQAISFAIELASLILQQPAALTGATAAEVLQRYRQAGPPVDPTAAEASR